MNSRSREGGIVDSSPVPRVTHGRPLQGANLLASDYQKLLPDGAGHDGTLLLTSSDTSRQYVLVLDVDGCFG